MHLSPNYQEIQWFIDLHREINTWQRYDRFSDQFHQVDLVDVFLEAFDKFAIERESDFSLGRMMEDKFQARDSQFIPKSW